MKKLGTSDIKAIACATYNGTNDVTRPDRTVGICVFTTNKANNIFATGYQKLLRDEAGKFDKDYMKLIERHEVTPLEEREK
ncbi:MAG: hypothetical protein JWM21_832 [Acidobacteria bacterium]|nr:hypothetical protein [Acidobacteriota bacterium]